MGIRFGTNNVAVRAAASLAATAVEYTASIPCLGAGLVSFEVLATSADVPAAAIVQVSNDPTTTADASSTWQDGRANIAATSVTNDITSTAANAGGSRGFLFATGAANAIAHGIPWQKCRLKLTGHATNAITGLAVNATVFTLGEP